MTDPLASLRELLEKATPTLWTKARAHAEVDEFFKVGAGNTAGCALVEGEANAALIVAVVNALPDLLSTLTQQQEEIERLRRAEAQAHADVETARDVGDEVASALRARLARIEGAARKALTHTHENVRNCLQSSECVYGELLRSALAPDSPEGVGEAFEWYCQTPTCDGRFTTDMRIESVSACGNCGQRNWSRSRPASSDPRPTPPPSRRVSKSSICPCGAPTATSSSASATASRRR